MTGKFYSYLPNVLKSAIFQSCIFSIPYMEQTFAFQFDWDATCLVYLSTGPRLLVKL